MCGYSNYNGVFCDGVHYTWNDVYKLSGLCKDDFRYDSTNSWETFKKYLKNP